MDTSLPLLNANFTHNFHINSLKVLVIEDSENDYLLLLRELKKSDKKIIHKRVDNHLDFINALDEKWDVILSDFELNGFNGYDALVLCKERNIDTPFIIISGVIGEENAVRLMKAGARDYFVKGNLSRLIPAIEREIIEYQKRVETKIIQKQKEDSQIETQRLLEIADKSRDALLSMIEDLKYAKDKAEEMNKVKSYFFSIMSHELRTPFVGIMGYAEILKNEISNPNHLKYLDIIIRSSKRLTHTLNKILLLSKIESEEIPVNLEEINLFDLIENDIKLFLPAIDKQKLSLIKTYNKTPLKIKSDSKLLSEIFCNLLDNAIKFTLKGEIEISYETEKVKDKDSIILKIKDTGFGIPSDKIDLIWKEFRQVSEGQSRGFEGTGLGLTITKKYVERLGGTIDVESEEGVGSIFTVVLPLIISNDKKEEKTKSQKETIVENSAPHKKKKLLYVEDDKDARNLLTIVLSKFFNLECASDSKTALELIKTKEYDGILLDINLGVHSDLDGVELAAIILSEPIKFNNPIIAITSFASDKDKEEFLSKGFSHYISKPFGIDELKNMLNKIFYKG